MQGTRYEKSDKCNPPVSEVSSCPDEIDSNEAIQSPLEISVWRKKIFHGDHSPGKIYSSGDQIWDHMGDGGKKMWFPEQKSSLVTTH